MRRGWLPTRLLPKSMRYKVTRVCRPMSQIEVFGPVGSGYDVRVGYERLEATVALASSGGTQAPVVVVAGQAFALAVRRVGNRWRVDGPGALGGAWVELSDEADVAPNQGLASELAVLAVACPMTGTIIDVVAVDRVVKRGDVLAVVETMKMESEILAKGPGIVTRVLVASGDRVQAGDALLELESVGQGEAT